MDSLSRISTSLLVLPLLAGCMSTTASDPAAVRADLQAWNAEVYKQGEQLNAATEKRTAQVESDQQAARLGDGANARSLTLDELYVAGIANNYRLMAARKSIDVADAELVNATMRFFPSLNGT